MSLRDTLKTVAFVVGIIMLAQVVGNYTGGRCAMGDRFWCGVYVGLGGRLAP